MKTKKIILGLGLLLLLITLGSCKKSGPTIDYNYSSSNTYYAIDKTGTGKFTTVSTKLDIDWLSGDINIAFHDKAYIEIKEKGNQRLSEEERYHYAVTSTNLIFIKYAKNETPIDVNLSKELTIYVPKGTNFDSLTINNQSGNVSIDLGSMKIDAANIKTSAGNVDIKGTESSEIGILGIETIAGNIQATIEEMLTMGIKSKTGNVVIKTGFVKMGKIDIDSGNVRYSTENTKEENHTMWFESKTGMVDIELPNTLSFTMNFTNTKNIETSFAWTEENVKIVNGEGNSKYYVENQSGTVTILKK